MLKTFPCHSILLCMRVCTLVLGREASYSPSCRAERNLSIVLELVDMAKLLGRMVIKGGREGEGKERRGGGCRWE